MNEEINKTNEIIEVETSKTVYDVAQNINTMLSVLTFTIIVIFLFNYLKSGFSLKR